MIANASKNRLGRHVSIATAGERVEAYLPPPLPPDPPVRIGQLHRKLDHANLAIGRLQGIASTLPDREAFIRMQVRKEAVLSSQIEGIRCSLSDLLLYESGHDPSASTADVEDVANHVTAMDHGFERIKGGFPLSLRLIRDTHRALMASTRSAMFLPGEFRRSQNWIGGTRPGNARFVPPPPSEVVQLMGDLALHLHSSDPAISDLVKAGLMHVQFETIHPFLDGNGRVGRMMIPFFLCERGILEEPILCLSEYLMAHRPTYYELLNSVRLAGDWEAWLEFFLDGIFCTASQATNAARNAKKLFEADRGKILGLGRQAASALQLHQLAISKPLFSVPDAAKQLGLVRQTIAKSIRNLEAIGILHEVRLGRRARIFAYSRYLETLNQSSGMNSDFRTS